MARLLLFFVAHLFFQPARTALCVFVRLDTRTPTHAGAYAHSGARVTCACGVWVRRAVHPPHAGAPGWRCGVPFAITYTSFEGGFYCCARSERSVFCGADVRASEQARRHAQSAKPRARAVAHTQRCTAGNKTHSQRSTATATVACVYNWHGSAGCVLAREHRTQQQLWKKKSWLYTLISVHSHTQQCEV